MRVVVQRVKEAKCVVDDKVTGAINKGFLLFIGFSNNDTLDILPKVASKVMGLRIFEDEFGKMNKSLKDMNASILAISQFTLYSDCKHGNRPSFTEAMKYDLANEYYLKFVNILKENGYVVETGVFGADMKIHLINDGPVTIIIDSEKL